VFFFVKAFPTASKDSCLMLNGGNGPTFGENGLPEVVPVSSSGVGVVEDEVEEAMTGGREGEEVVEREIGDYVGEEEV
jgi:hypothetical protein